MTRVVITQVGERGLTTNAERKLDRYERARIVRAWRVIGKAQAHNARRRSGALLTPVHAFVTPLQATNRHTADVGAHLPTAKALIDGAVDARLIPGDEPRYLSRLTFEAPELGGHDGIRLVIATAAGDACVACDLPLEAEEGLAFATGRRICAPCLRTLAPIA